MFGENVNRLTGESCLTAALCSMIPVIGCLCVRPAFRKKVREAYNLEETCMCDCCAAGLFFTCAACQESREVRVDL